MRLPPNDSKNSIKKSENTNKFNIFSKFSHFNRIDFFVILLLALSIIFTRIPFISGYLYEWDSVNYAMAFNNYNIFQQQPHPPGYILYVALGKLINYIFNDPNSTMIATAILFTILSSLILYWMVNEIFSRKIAIISSLLFVFNPLIWFYGEIASIYIFESFWAILIAFSSYKCLNFKNIDINRDKNKFKQDNSINNKFIYISAFFLGIAGGFRIDIVELMIPLWLYCVYKSGISPFKIIKSFLVLISAILMWFLPTIYLTGGFSQYMALMKSTSAAAGHTSMVLGASLMQQVFNSGACLVWILLGLTLSGLIIISFIAISSPYGCFRSFKKKNNFNKNKDHISSWLILGINGMKSGLYKLWNNQKSMFFTLWILPAFVFYLLIYVVKPGYLLNILPAIIILMAYALVKMADRLSFKFPKLSKNKLAMYLLIFCILTNVIYFVYPLNLHEGDIWETQVNQMTTSQEITYLIDVGFCYNNAKIAANDQNTKFNIAAILNTSHNDSNRTIIVIRDFTREDEGFNWRKAMFYLPDYNVYYLFDDENAGLKNQVSSWHAHKGSYNVSMASNLDIDLNSSVDRIIWIMSDQSEFYKEVKNKMGLNTIYLSNGLKVYYSDIGNTSEDTQISGFVFKNN